MTNTQSICAGLHGEFYIITTFTTGATTISQAYNSFAQAQDAVR